MLRVVADRQRTPDASPVRREISPLPVEGKLVATVLELEGLADIHRLYARSRTRYEGGGPEGSSGQGQGQPGGSGGNISSGADPARESAVVGGTTAGTGHDGGKRVVLAEGGKNKAEGAAQQ